MCGTFSLLTVFDIDREVLGVYYGLFRGRSKMKNEKLKPLTKDEELNLGEAIQKGLKAQKRLNSGEKCSELIELVELGQRAEEKLVRCNIGLVHDRAQHFKRKYPSSPEYDDLVQEGMCGLMIAVRKYDPSRNNKFSTVAYHWINQAITRGANTTGRTIRMPENRIYDYTHMNRIASRPENLDRSQEEVDAIICRELNLTPETVSVIRRAARGATSLNRLVSTNDQSRELIEIVGESNASPGAETEMFRNRVGENIMKAVYGLDELHRDVILSSFKFDKDLTPDVVRKRHSLPPFLFRKLKNEALDELRSSLLSQGIEMEDFLEQS